MTETLSRAVHALGKYSAIAKINAQSRFAYIPNVMGELPITLFRIWVMTQFYTATYATTGTREFDSLSFIQLMWCLMFVLCFEASSTEPGVSKMIEDEVKTGSVAYSINKPYSYPWFQYAGFLGRTIPNVLINLAGGIGITFVLVGPLPITATGLLLGGLLMFIGCSLHFLIDLSIGLLAFWIEDVESVAWLYQCVMLVFGGVILPIALFPEPFKTIAEYLPFGQLYYSAARLLVHFDSAFFFHFLAVQLVWVGVFLALSLFIWRKGMKNVSISGG